MFIDILKKLIDEKGITQKQFLFEVGLNKNSIRVWEQRGNVPNKATIATIANYFDVTIDYLINGVEIEDAPTGGHYMFLQTLKKLLKGRNITKNKMLTDLHLGKNSFVNWEQRGTIPSGDALQRIADYFNVTVDYLLTGEETQVAVDFALSTHEKQVVTAYRDQPQMQPAVDKLLGIDGAE